MGKTLEGVRIRLSAVMAGLKNKKQLQKTESVDFAATRPSPWTRKDSFPTLLEFPAAIRIEDNSRSLIGP